VVVGNPEEEVVQNSGHLTREQAAKLAGRLTELRKLAGLSVEDLGKALGMKRTTAYTLVNGDKDITLGEMLLAVRALNLRSIEELLGPLGTSEFLRLAPEQGN
jgi:transcriptional regulator with XRE-family HTH domain